MGFSHVSLSSHVTPMVKAVPRGFTASSDAYLTPHIKAYLKVVVFLFSCYLGFCFLDYFFIVSYDESSADYDGC